MAPYLYFFNFSSTLKSQTVRLIVSHNSQTFQLISPQGYSLRGSPPALCHPVARANYTLSLCRRSCPQCTQPRAPLGVCGTLEDCSHPCDPSLIASSGPESGRRHGHYRRPGHLHQHSPAGGRNGYILEHKETVA